MPAVQMIEEATRQREKEIPAQAAVEPAEEAGKGYPSCKREQRIDSRPTRERYDHSSCILPYLRPIHIRCLRSDTHTCTAQAAGPLHGGVWVFGHGLAFLCSPRGFSSVFSAHHDAWCHWGAGQYFKLNWMDGVETLVFSEVVDMANTDSHLSI
jgi:hypothetical protein